MGELAWERVSDANTVVKLGEQVTVKVIKLDWPKHRITLSLRQAGSDPWDGIEAKLMVGMSYKGKVTRLADFGAFVQLEPGLEGLLHISKLAPGRRIGHPREVVDAGQELDVYIEGIDTERRRIALSLEQRRPTAAAAAAGSDPAPPEAAAVGAEVKGTVVEVRPFGVFVKLSERQTGLLHLSEIEAAGGGKSAMMRDFPVGKEVTVLVKAYKEGKVSLALPGAHNEDGDYRQFLSDGQQPPRDLGSLGGLFDQIKL
jgi:small subunit ribosomal protein S1